MRATMFTAAVLAFALAGPARAAATQELYLREDANNTPVSGETGAKTTVLLPESLTKLPEFYGVRGLSVEEKSDEPCQLKIQWADLNDPVSEGIDFVDKCDGTSLGGEKTASFTGRTYVSGLRVCLDRDHERVKGVELRGRTVESNGALRGASNRPAFERTNCRDWMDWVECPSGKIASGLNLHFEGGGGARSLKGIGLVCRTVALREPEWDQAVFAGAITETSRAGAQGGLERVLKPGNSNDNMLSGIVWSEKSDNPCLVTAKGATMGPQTRKLNDSYDGCGGKSRDGSRREAGRGEGSLPAAGVRVCLKNGKVKGIELSYVYPGDPTAKPSTYEGGVDTQPNCRVGDRDWTDWAECPRGQAAIGLRAFFDGNRAPVSLTGLKLLCRRIE